MPDTAEEVKITPVDASVNEALTAKLKKIAEALSKDRPDIDPNDLFQEGLMGILESTHTTHTLAWFKQCAKWRMKKFIRGEETESHARSELKKAQAQAP